MDRLSGGEITMRRVVRFVDIIETCFGVNKFTMFKSILMTIVIYTKLSRSGDNVCTNTEIFMRWIGYNDIMDE